MRRFHPPIHLTVAAATLVAGLASYQGVDHLTLAKSDRPYSHKPGHETPKDGTSTSTTLHDKPTSSTTLPPEPGSTTSTTAPHEPGSTTSTTVHHEPTPSSTSTTVHHEPTSSSTSTTVPHEPPPSTSPPTVPQLSFYCMSGMTGGQGASKCSWSQSTAPNFHHYRLTRELVGTPRQTIFESTDRSTWYYYDLGLQPGAEYSYIIEAYDADGHLVGRSSAFHITCCGGGTGTT